MQQNFTSSCGKEMLLVKTEVHYKCNFLLPKKDSYPVGSRPFLADPDVWDRIWILVLTNYLISTVLGKVTNIVESNVILLNQLCTIKFSKKQMQDPDVLESWIWIRI
jgi:hypothetical protein